MVCGECLTSFFYSPFKLSIITISLVISALSLFLIRKTTNLDKKIIFIYIHIFTLIFPFLFYLFFRGCQTYFTACEAAKATFVMLSLTLLIAFIIGFLIAPILFLSKYAKNSAKLENSYILNFISKHSKIFNIKNPKFYLINLAKPVAFSLSNIKPSIFVSVGLFDLLNKKEINAVLLHELWHIKNKTSLLKFSAYFLRFISPLSRFSISNKELDKEEIKADSFVFKVQKTKKYLVSAKRKINSYK